MALPPAGSSPRRDMVLVAIAVGDVSWCASVPSGDTKISCSTTIVSKIAAHRKTVVVRWMSTDALDNGPLRCDH